MNPEEVANAMVALGGLVRAAKAGVPGIDIPDDVPVEHLVAAAVVLTAKSIDGLALGQPEGAFDRLLDAYVLDALRTANDD